MKNFIISISIAAIIITIFAFRQTQENSIGALGDIKYSILPPDKFNELNGNGWVLLDGRIITGSDLQTGGFANEIPDARGMFIRGLNLTRTDEKADPFAQENNRQRVVGEYQPDEFKSHSHTLNFAPAINDVINTTELNF